MLGMFYSLRLPAEYTFSDVFKKVNALHEFCAHSAILYTSNKLSRFEHHGESAFRPAPSPLWGHVGGGVAKRFEIAQLSPKELGQDHREVDSDSPPLSVNAIEAYTFDVLPAHGCFELATLGVGRWPEVVQVPHSDPALPPETIRLPDEFRGWFGRDACFNSGCAAPQLGGLMNFLRAHLSLTLALDTAIELGFEVTVGDLTEFWDERDIDALVARIGSHTVEQAKSIGRFKDENPGVIMVDEVMKRPDFERLEAGYAPSLPDDWREEHDGLAALLDTVCRNKPNAGDVQ